MEIKRFKKRRKLYDAVRSGAIIIGFVGTAIIAAVVDTMTSSDIALMCVLKPLGLGAVLILAAYIAYQIADCKDKRLIKRRYRTIWN